MIMEKAKWYNKWLYSFIKPHLGKRNLEISAGIGNFTEILTADNFLVDATDIEEKYLRLLKNRFQAKNVNVIRLNLEKKSVQIKSNYYDAAICLNVLEHIKNDKGALKIIYRRLKIGGRLILLVPAHRILYGSLDINLGHKRRYTRDELRKKLKSAGFKTEKTRYLNFIGAFGWFLNSKILKREIVSETQVILFDKLTRPLLQVEKIIKLTSGLSLFVVAKK